jgi:hypothetical protein
MAALFISMTAASLGLRYADPAHGGEETLAAVFTMELLIILS